MGRKNWDIIRKRGDADSLHNRDVYESQQLDRTKAGQKQTFTSRHIVAISVGLFVAILVWSVWSYFDISRLDNESAANANMAVVITQPAPAAPRDYADVTWANMLLVNDDTYASYGYTYVDTKTGIKYTQAEYEIWLDVHRRINNKECPDILYRNNPDGTRTYVERDPVDPAPSKPRVWSHATALNFWSRGIVEDNIYSDLGYDYRELYSNTPLTKAEYESLLIYNDKQYAQSLVDEGFVTFTREDIVDQNGMIRTISKYKDIKSDVIAIDIPTESAGSRYTTPIDLDDVTYANLILVADSSASLLGYSHRDERSGKFFTRVEYEKWKTVRNDAIYGRNGLILWVDVSQEDGNYVFAAKPPNKAGSQPRKRVAEMTAAAFMKMNMSKDDRFWSDYGYIYYDKKSRMFYSEAEYNMWLNVQNQVANGELQIPQKTQTEIRSENIAVTDAIAQHLDPLPEKHDFTDGFMSVTVWKALASFGIGVAVYLLLKTVLKRNLDAQNAMHDTSDINQYEDDQHIALPEEVQRKFDWFPDAGAHCPVQVSSMISHVMLKNKGLKSIQVAKRYEKDVIGADGEVEFYKGEIIVDEDGEPILETVSMIDSKFGDALYEASDVPESIRKYYDATNIPYNPNGKDRTKQGGAHKTVADMINKSWSLPIYEPQRPAGAYLVDTEPVNTLVLAITRAGKGKFSPVCSVMSKSCMLIALNS